MENSLAGQLARRGHDVQVISRLGEHGPRRNGNGSPLHFVDPGTMTLKLPGGTPFPFFAQLARYTRAFDPDIMHVNNLPFLTTVQGVRVSKQIGIKSVVQVHGVTARRDLVTNALQEAFLWATRKYLFGDASYLLCLTGSDAERLRRLGCPPRKIRLVPNGVDTKFFKPIESQRLYDFIWAGRFVPEKGLHILLRSFKLALDTEPTLRLALVGDGPLVPSIKQLANRLGIANRVSFLGKVSNDDMPKLLATAGVFVLPSLSEGMPYSVLEAMACAKPIVASDLPGTRELVTQGVEGILIPPGNVEELGACLVRLAGDFVERSRMSVRAREKTVRTYDWSKIVGSMESIYKDTVSQHQLPN